VPAGQIEARPRPSERLVRSFDHLGLLGLALVWAAGGGFLAVDVGTGPSSAVRLLGVSLFIATRFARWGLLEPSMGAVRLLLAFAAGLAGALLHDDATMSVGLLVAVGALTAGPRTG
jgi:hypothetical protein